VCTEENNHHQTPLTLAVRNVYADTVKVLLDHGAPPENPDIFGLEPLVKVHVEAGATPITI
jgi:ankyrin repeat protein